jgi:hypothetical protein
VRLATNAVGTPAALLLAFKLPAPAFVAKGIRAKRDPTAAVGATIVGFPRNIFLFFQN